MSIQVSIAGNGLTGLRASDLMRAARLMEELEGIGSKAHAAPNPVALGQTPRVFYPDGVPVTKQRLTSFDPVASGQHIRDSVQRTPAQRAAQSLKMKSVWRRKRKLAKASTAALAKVSTALAFKEKAKL